MRELKGTQEFWGHRPCLTEGAGLGQQRAQLPVVKVAMSPERAGFSSSAAWRHCTWGLSLSLSSKPIMMIKELLESGKSLRRVCGV